MTCLCSICGKDFDANPMWHHKEGLCSEICRKMAHRRNSLRYEHSDKGEAADMRWRVNPAKKEIDKRYRQTAPAKAKAVIRARRTLANNPHLQERKRERDKIYAQTEWGKQVNREATKRYRQTEHGALVLKAGKHRRRGAPGSFTPEEWNAKLAACNYRCARCGSSDHIEIDHIVPVSKGGSNGIDNLQPLCRSCNASKGNHIKRHDDQMFLRMPVRAYS